MAINTKAIKQRIKSVKNTKKMTKAMEMVSAAKMRKAVQATLATRLYATLARDLLLRLSKMESVETPLTEVRPVENILLLLISSNRGLCGSFNSNVFKKASKLLKDKIVIAQQPVVDGQKIPVNLEPTVDIIGVGRKSAAFAKKHGYNLIAAFGDLPVKPTFSDISPISSMARQGFLEKKYDKVFVIYTDFVSSLRQEVRIRQLLPVTNQEIEALLGDVYDGATPAVDLRTEYEFEPDPKAVTESILPKLVEVQAYQAILESAASEHSARMLAMKNASSAAGDMITILTLEFNKARQAAITQEIAEIAGGAMALE